VTDRTRWEYKVVGLSPDNDGCAEVRLNTWGSAGWEVIAVSVQFTSHFVWMKRQVIRTAQ
jgi:hypothetical protein